MIEEWLRSDPIRDQFEKMLEEDAKAGINDQITDAVTQVSNKQK